MNRLQEDHERCLQENGLFPRVPQYLTGFQHVEHEWDACRQELGAVILRLDGEELSEEQHNDLVSAQLLSSLERRQPGVEPPGNTWNTTGSYT